MHTENERPSSCLKGPVFQCIYPDYTITVRSDPLSSTIILTRGRGTYPSIARYWADPHTFNPKRFLAADWPRDAFLPFSAGPRACLGRRFTETESVVAVAMIILRYKVTIKEEKRFASETFEQKKTRVLRGQPGVSMT